MDHFGTDRPQFLATTGSAQDWLVPIPLVFNSTLLGLDLLSPEKRVGLELRPTSSQKPKLQHLLQEVLELV